MKKTIVIAILLLSLFSIVSCGNSSSANGTSGSTFTLNGAAS